MINSINQSLIALALSIVYLFSSSTTSYIVESLPLRWIVLVAGFVFVEFMLVSMVIDDILRKLSSKDYHMTRVPGSIYYLQRDNRLPSENLYYLRYNSLRIIQCDDIKSGSSETSTDYDSTSAGDASNV